MKPVKPTGHLARQTTCSCGAAVWSGQDGNGHRRLVCDIAPLDASRPLDLALAITQHSWIASLIPAGYEGHELHTRDTWTYYDNRWPALAPHHCPKKKENELW